MTDRVTPTLALILAGGLAAGIALARPGSDPAVAAGADAGSGVEAEGEPARPRAPRRGGYLDAAPTPDASAGGQELQPEPAAEGQRPAPAPVEMRIVDFDFAGPASVSPGQTITVTNDDQAAHTLTADSGAFDTGTIAGGGTSSVTAPAEPGVYEFFCTIHPSMRGSVTVG